MSFSLKPFVDAVASESLCLNGVVVLQHGVEIARHHWTPEVPQNQYSATKSFTATAVGMAVKEGLMDLEEPVLPIFPGEAPAEPSAFLKNLRVKHLLTMTLGHDRALLMGGDREKLEEQNWVRYALNQPLVYEPGTHYCYNNAGPYLAGVILEKRAGTTLLDYLMPRLFDPLDIPRPVWEVCPMGHTFGAGGMFLTVSNLAKFGQLYLQNGNWKGAQLVPEDWTRAVGKVQVPFDPSVKAITIGYGYLFWVSPDGVFRADGKFGQYSIVVPKADAVIAINSTEEKKTGMILELVGRELLSQLR